MLPFKSSHIDAMYENRYKEIGNKSPNCILKGILECTCLEIK